MNGSSLNDRHNDFPDSRQARLSLLAAVLLSGAVALLFANTVAESVSARPEWVLRDWTQVWRGANALARGENPWAPLPQTLEYPYRDRNAYPLPALWIGQLVNFWSLHTIAMWWVGVSMLAAGVVLARQNLWRACALFSWPAIGAASLLQWSPLLLTAARWDALVILAACKPNLGIAILAYRPTLRRFAIVGAVGALSLLLQPGWIGEWRQAATSLHYRPPVMVWQAGGPLLALAALRWRVPEGRLLLALALVPHNLMAYDSFLLFLACKRGRETFGLVALGWIAGWWVQRHIDPGMSVTAMQQQFPVPTIALLYLPVLALVLSRPSPVSFQVEPEEPAALHQF